MCLLKLNILLLSAQELENALRLMLDILGGNVQNTRAQCSVYHHFNFSCICLFSLKFMNSTYVHMKFFVHNHQYGASHYLCKDDFGNF